jgi:sortase A
MVAAKKAGGVVTTLEAPRVQQDPDPGLPVAVSPGPLPTRTAETRPLGVRLTFVLPLALSLLAVWFLVFAFVLSGLQEHASQGRLYDRFRLQLAEETAPLAEPVPVGAPVAMINSPSAGMRNVIVVEGTTSRLLKGGPGHLSDTVLPGQLGDVVLFGRSTTYGGPFGRITSMKPGERFTVTTGQGVFTYSVEDVRFPGDPLPPLLKANQSRLTLVTSVGGSWTTAWVPTHTAYVDALLVGGQAQPVPAGVPSSVSKASQPMQGDPSGLVPLIFWLEALAAATFAIGWYWIRWGKTATWLAGAPILLAALWGTSDALMRFLPNLV